MTLPARALPAFFLGSGDHEPATSSQHHNYVVALAYVCRIVFQNLEHHRIVDLGDVLESTASNSSASPCAPTVFEAGNCWDTLTASEECTRQVCSTLLEKLLSVSTTCDILSLTCLLYLTKSVPTARAALFTRSNVVESLSLALTVAASDEHTGLCASANDDAPSSNGAGPAAAPELMLLHSYCQDAEILDHVLNSAEDLRPAITAAMSDLTVLLARAPTVISHEHDAFDVEMHKRHTAAQRLSEVLAAFADISTQYEEIVLEAALAPTRANADGTGAGEVLTAVPLHAMQRAACTDASPSCSSASMSKSLGALATMLIARASALRISVTSVPTREVAGTEFYLAAVASTSPVAAASARKPAATLSASKGTATSGLASSRLQARTAVRTESRHDNGGGRLAAPASSSGSGMGVHANSGSGAGGAPFRPPAGAIGSPVMATPAASVASPTAPRARAASPKLQISITDDNIGTRDSSRRHQQAPRGNDDEHANGGAGGGSADSEPLQMDDLGGANTNMTSRFGHASGGATFMALPPLCAACRYAGHQSFSQAPMGFGGSTSSRPASCSCGRHAGLTVAGVENARADAAAGARAVVAGLDHNERTNVAENEAERSRTVIQQGLAQSARQRNGADTGAHAPASTNIDDTALPSQIARQQHRGGRHSTGPTAAYSDDGGNIFDGMATYATGALVPSPPDITFGSGAFAHKRQSPAPDTVSTGTGAGSRAADIGNNKDAVVEPSLTQAPRTRSAHKRVRVSFGAVTVSKHHPRKQHDRINASTGAGAGEVESQALELSDSEPLTQPAGLSAGAGSEMSKQRSRRDAIYATPGPVRNRRRDASAIDDGAEDEGNADMVFDAASWVAAVLLLTSTAVSSHNNSAGDSTSDGASAGAAAASSSSAHAETRLHLCSRAITSLQVLVTLLKHPLDAQPVLSALSGLCTVHELVSAAAAAASLASLSGAASTNVHCETACALSGGIACWLLELAFRLQLKSNDNDRMLSASPERIEDIVTDFNLAAMKLPLSAGTASSTGSTSQQADDAGCAAGTSDAARLIAGCITSSNATIVAAGMSCFSALARSSTSAAVMVQVARHTAAVTSKAASRLKAQDAANSDLQSKLRNSTSEYAALQSSNTAQMVVREAKAQALQAQVASLQKSLADQAQAATQRQLQAAAASTDEANALRNQIALLQSQLAQARVQVQAHVDRYSTATAALEAESVKGAAVKSQLQQATSLMLDQQTEWNRERATLQASISSLQNEAQAAANARSVAEAAASEAQQQLLRVRSESESAITSLQNEIQRVRTQLAAGMQEAKQAKEQLQQMEASVQRMQVSLARESNRGSAAESEIATLGTELADSRAQVSVAKQQLAQAEGRCTEPIAANLDLQKAAQISRDKALAALASFETARKAGIDATAERNKALEMQKHLLNETRTQASSILKLERDSKAKDERISELQQELDNARAQAQHRLSGTGAASSSASAAVTVQRPSSTNANSGKRNRVQFQASSASAGTGASDGAAAAADVDNDYGDGGYGGEDEDDETGGDERGTRRKRNSWADQRNDGGRRRSRGSGRAGDAGSGAGYSASAAASSSASAAAAAAVNPGSPDPLLFRLETKLNKADSEIRRLRSVVAELDTKLSNASKRGKRKAAATTGLISAALAPGQSQLVLQPAATRPARRALSGGAGRRTSTGQPERHAQVQVYGLPSAPDTPFEEMHGVTSPEVDHDDDDDDRDGRGNDRMAAGAGRDLLTRGRKSKGAAGIGRAAGDEGGIDTRAGRRHDRAAADTDDDDVHDRRPKKGLRWLEDRGPSNGGSSSHSVYAGSGAGGDVVRQSGSIAALFTTTRDANSSAAIASAGGGGIPISQLSRRGHHTICDDTAPARASSSSSLAFALNDGVSNLGPGGRGSQPAPGTHTGLHAPLQHSGVARRTRRRSAGTDQAAAAFAHAALPPIIEQSVYVDDDGDRDVHNESNATVAQVPVSDDDDEAGAGGASGGTATKENDGWVNARAPSLASARVGATSRGPSTSPSAAVTSAAQPLRSSQVSTSVPAGLRLPQQGVSGRVHGLPPPPPAPSTAAAAVLVLQQRSSNVMPRPASVTAGTKVGAASISSGATASTSVLQAAVRRR